MLADLDAGEAHGLVPLGGVGRMLLDVACPLRAIGPVMVPLDLDEYTVTAVAPVGDPEQPTVPVADPRIQFRLGETSWSTRVQERTTGLTWQLLPPRPRARRQQLASEADQAPRVPR